VRALKETTLTSPSTCPSCRNGSPSHPRPTSSSGSPPSRLSASTSRSCAIAPWSRSSSPPAAGSPRRSRWIAQIGTLSGHRAQWRRRAHCGHYRACAGGGRALPGRSEGPRRSPLPELSLRPPRGRLTVRGAEDVCARVGVAHRVTKLHPHRFRHTGGRSCRRSSAPAAHGGVPGSPLGSVAGYTEVSARRHE
jgi:hypothetical protein